MNGALSPMNLQRADRRLPSTVQEVVRLVNDTRTSVARLAAAVAKHHILAESVLRKANMSVYGLPGRVKNLNSAVVLLGFDALKETSRGVLIAYAGRKATDMVVQNLEMWDHSVGCAVIARFVAHRSGACDPDTAFIAGLLHDIGAFFPPSKKQQKVIPSPLSDGPPAPGQVERFPHAYAGAEMALQWGLPRDILEAIGHHHQPWLAKRKVRLTGVIHVAEYLTHWVGVGMAEYEQVDSLDPDALDGLDVPEFSSPEAILASLIESGATHGPGVSVLGWQVNDVKKRLFDALDRLPDQQRLILALRYFEGLSAAEIGLVLDMPPSAAGMHLAEAMNMLRRALTQMI